MLTFKLLPEWWILSLGCDLRGEMWHYLKLLFSMIGGICVFLYSSVNEI